MSFTPSLAKARWIMAKYKPNRANAPLANEPWTEEHKRLLREMFENYEPLIVMAQTLGRSATATCAMLVNLKLIYYWKEDECYYPYRRRYATNASLRNLDQQLKEQQNDNNER